MITNQQPEITKGMSCLPYTEGLEAAYTFEPRFGGPVCMGVREDGRFWVPRETCPIGKHDLRRRYEPGLTAINCSAKPLDDQAPAIKKSVELLKAGRNHICEAPTGWGKSVVGSMIAVEMRQPTLIIVPKDDLINGDEQWFDTLTQLIGVPVDKIGIVQQNKCDFQGKWFVLGMMQSIVKDGKYPPEFFDYFGMVVWDECHHLGAETFVLSCQKFSAYYRLGLSATARRADGKAPLFHAHLGPTLVKGTVVPMKPKIVVKPTGWRIPPSWTKESGEWEKKVVIPSGDRMMKVFKEMAESPSRNAHIVNFVTQAHRKGRTTLVLSDLIVHLQNLHALLVAAGVPGEEIAYYISGKGQWQVQRAMCRVPGKVKAVLGTYKMVSEGTNVPHWDTEVLCTPHASAEQSLGRILRKREGKVQPVCLDLVDGDNIFKGYFYAREREYYGLKADFARLQ